MNQKDKTLRCLSSFREVKAPPEHRILVWDNGSHDGTTDAIRDTYPEVLVHYHPENLGVAGGRNAAAALAIRTYRPSFLFFIDNDMTVMPDALAQLLKPVKNNPQAGQATGKILDFHDHQRVYGAGGCGLNFWLGRTSHVGYGMIDRGQFDQPHECIASGGCMLVPTHVFQQLDGFDLLFNPYGPEDLDFGLRVRMAGYKGLYVPESVVFHDSTPGRTLHSGGYTQDYARTKSAMWWRLMSRHATMLERLGFVLIGAPCILLVLVLREGRRGNLGALTGWIKGVGDFWRSRGSSHCAATGHGRGK